jgi:hypothetical protein
MFANHSQHTYATFYSADGAAKLVGPATAEARRSLGDRD